MVLALTMIMGILTGCGAGSDGSASGSTGGFGTKEITVSEMIHSFAEEDNNGEFVTYRFELSEDDVEAVVAEETTVADVVLNNKVVVTYKSFNNNEKTVSAGFINKTEMYLTDLIALDPLSNDFDGQTEVKRSKQRLSLYTYDDTGIITYEGYSGCLYSNTFERVEIEGKTYMLFALYEFNFNGKIIGVTCTMIEDTDYTKDKTVVLDTLETEGIDEVRRIESGIGTYYYEKQLPNK